MIPLVPFGRTGLVVSRLGLGTGRLGELDEADAHRLLDAALDLGIRLFDTAPSYGRAEEHLSTWRRARSGGSILCSTKVGYGVPGVPDWTAEAIARGIERAAARFGGAIDVVHLHSCPGEVAVRDDVQRALVAALERGLARVVAYAGENEDLDRALGATSFGAVQVSVNLVDQGSRALRAGYFAERGLGVIAKRASASAPWAAPADARGPEGEYVARFRALGLRSPEEGWASLSLRFAAHSPGVHVALLGTRSPSRLEEAARAVARGPLADDVLREIEAAWRRHGAGLRGVV